MVEKGIDLCYTYKGYYFSKSALGKEVFYAQTMCLSDSTRLNGSHGEG